MKCLSTILIFILLLPGCVTKNQSEKQEADSSGSEVVEELDGPGDDSMAQSTGSLVIQGKEIWVRDEPVFGNVIFKLNDGDVAAIYRAGPFDVIKGKANLWYWIDFNGQFGWVFGSQTDQQGFDWPDFGASNEGVRDTTQYFIAPTFEGLWKQFGEYLKTTEIKSDSTNESAPTRDVVVKDSEIEIYEGGDGESTSINYQRVFQDDKLALITGESFHGAAGFTRSSHTTVAQSTTSGWRFVGNLDGKVMEVINQGSIKLIIVNHEYSASPGFIIGQLDVYRFEQEKIKLTQSLAFHYRPTGTGGDPVELPNAWRGDGKFISPYLEYDKINVETRINNGTPELIVLEHFAQVETKRFYNWNKSKFTFEERSAGTGE